MLTRALVNAALSGALEDVPTIVHPVFKVHIPTVCPGCDDTSLLNPRDTWPDKAAYDDRAQKLASEFAAHFEKAYGDKGIDDAVIAQCPGR